jgi:hypothetical protein
MLEEKLKKKNKIHKKYAKKRLLNCGLFFMQIFMYFYQKNKSVVIWANMHSILSFFCWL